MLILKNSSEYSDHILLSDHSLSRHQYSGYCIVNSWQSSIIKYALNRLIHCKALCFHVWFIRSELIPLSGTTFFNFIELRRVFIALRLISWRTKTPFNLASDGVDLFDWVYAADNIFFIFSYADVIVIKCEVGRLSVWVLMRLLVWQDIVMTVLNWIPRSFLTLEPSSIINILIYCGNFFTITARFLSENWRWILSNLIISYYNWTFDLIAADWHKRWL